jgi:hypothetical protein
VVWIPDCVHEIRLQCCDESHASEFHYQLARRVLSRIEQFDNLETNLAGQYYVFQIRIQNQ